MYVARVKAESSIKVVTACGGMNFTQRDWIEVPNSLVLEAQACPFLEVKDASQVPGVAAATRARQRQAALDDRQAIEARQAEYAAKVAAAQAEEAKAKPEAKADQGKGALAEKEAKAAKAEGAAKDGGK